MRGLGLRCYQQSTRGATARGVSSSRAMHEGEGDRGTGGRGIRDEDLCERTGTAGAMRVRLAQTAFFFQGGSRCYRGTLKAHQGSQTGTHAVSLGIVGGGVGNAYHRCSDASVFLS